MTTSDRELGAPADSADNPERRFSIWLFRSFKTKLILLVALAVIVPSLFACLILGSQLYHQTRAIFASNLAAQLETFSLILQDSEDSLVKGVTRTAADNTLQVTLDLGIASQLSRYLDQQRKVLEVDFLAAYQPDGRLTSFSAESDQPGRGQWRLAGPADSKETDCAVERQVLSIAICDGTAYLVSVVAVKRRQAGDRGDATDGTAGSERLGYLMGGARLAGAALIKSLRQRQIAHAEISAGGWIAYSDLPVEKPLAAGTGGEQGQEYRIGGDVYLGSAKTIDVGGRAVTFGVLAPLDSLNLTLAKSVLTVAGVGALLAILTLIALGFIVGRIARPIRLLREGAARIGAGFLDEHINVATGDELEGLADQFNQMADHLRASYSELEGKVEERTRELAERQAVVRVTLDNIEHGVVLFDREFHLAAWNQRFQEIVDLPDGFLAESRSYEDYIGFLVRRGEFGAVDPEAEATRYRENATRASRFERIRPDGTVIEVRHNPVPGGGFVLIYSDITERKQIETALTVERDDAQEANQTKSSFLANMSHELRTPLNAIIGITEMLQEDARDFNRDDEIEPLERVTNAGRHLLSLINDILDLSKVEAGQMELHIESFGLEPLLHDVVKTVESLAVKNGNRVNVECDSAVGAIRADQMRLRQSLLNLISNANKFTENGIITITAQEKEEAGRGWITMSVADTGIGMAPEQMTKLFQDFSQADSSTTRKYGGTGLGLAISRRFCRMMGGDITVTSELNRGSTFMIRLPRTMEIAAAPSSPRGDAAHSAPAIQH